MISSFSLHEIEAGCDEAGRGCLAGPVVAAAVIFPKNYKNDFIIDSKKLTEKKRLQLAEIIKKEALDYSISLIDNHIIDEINILNASILAMHNALDDLKINPQFIIVDGNKFKNYKNIPYKCIIKGDSLYTSIAAASILAKTYRDELMKKLHNNFPLYNWCQNKGYPTLFHREQVKKHGFTDYHRLTFKIK